MKYKAGLQLGDLECRQAGAPSPLLPASRSSPLPAEGAQPSRALPSYRRHQSRDHAATERTAPPQEGATLPRLQLCTKAKSREQGPGISNRGCPGPGANRCGVWGTPRTDIGISEAHQQVMEGAGVSGEVAGGGAVTWGLGDCATTHSAHLRAVPAFPLHLLPLLGILPDPLRSREVPLGNRQASVSAPSPRGFRRTVHPPTPFWGRPYPAKGRRGLSKGGGSGQSQAGFMNGERPAHRLSDPWRPSGASRPRGLQET